MNDVTGARRVGANVSGKRLRRAWQAEEEQAQAQQMQARPNIPPRAQTSHPWAVQPGESCQGRRLHDFTMKGKDGLYRCWHCLRLSPRSRAKQQESA